jgi:hypothetical protein
MITTLTALAVPSDAVTITAIGGLLLILIVSEFVDYQASSLKFVVRYLSVFSVPLLVFFGFVTVIRLARAMFS